MRFSAFLAKLLVHCVLAYTSPVAVRLQYVVWSAIRPRHEASSVRQGMTEVGVGCVPQGRKEFTVGHHNDRAGLHGEGVRQWPPRSALPLKWRRASQELVQHLLGHAA